MQPQEPVGPARRPILLRNVLIGATTLIVLSVGAIGMSVLAGLRGPHQRQVADHTGPLVRVVSVLAAGPVMESMPGVDDEDGLSGVVLSRDGAGSSLGSNGCRVLWAPGP